MRSEPAGAVYPASRTPGLGGGLRAAVERTAAAVREEVEQEGRGGAAVGVFVGGEAVLSAGFGVADRATGAAVTPEHRFRIGSLTKPVTALALLLLIEEGRARRGDPARRFAPEIGRARNPFPGAPGPTLAQLATMTGGLAREPEPLAPYALGAPADWLETLGRALGHTRFEFEPGTRYRYSNIGYAVLGAAVERAAGRPFLEFVRERLLGPLGMDATGFSSGIPEESERVPAGAERIAFGHAAEGDGSTDRDTPRREREGRGYRVPNGGLWSTVADLGVLLRFLVGIGSPAFDAVLPAAARRDNLSPVVADADLGRGYGFGFMARRMTDAGGAGFTAYGHLGNLAGYRAAGWIEPGTDAAVVVLRNAGGESVSGAAAAGLARVVAALRRRSP